MALAVPLPDENATTVQDVNKWEQPKYFRNPKKTVDIRSLPEDATDSTILKTFECYGKILEYERNKSQAYIVYRQNPISDAVHAMKEKKVEALSDQPIEVYSCSTHKFKGKDHIHSQKPDHTIRVLNLRQNVKKSVVEREFQRFGHIEDCSKEGGSLNWFITYGTNPVIDVINEMERKKKSSTRYTVQQYSSPISVDDTKAARYREPPGHTIFLCSLKEELSASYVLQMLGKNFRVSGYYRSYDETSACVTYIDVVQREKAWNYFSLRKGAVAKDFKPGVDIEREDDKLCLSKHHLIQWLEDYDVKEPMLRLSNDGKPNTPSGKGQRYSTKVVGKTREFYPNVDENARKLVQEGVVTKPAQVVPANPVKNDRMDIIIQHAMKTEMLSHSGFVFGQKALREIGSASNGADDEYDFGSKLAIQKVGNNYFVHRFPTGEYLKWVQGTSQNNENQEIGMKFEEFYTEGKAKAEGEYWYTLVNRHGKCVKSSGEEHEFTMLVESELDSWKGENNEKSLVEMKASSKYFEEAKSNKKVNVWLQCDLANAVGMFFGKYPRDAKAKSVEHDDFTCKLFSFSEVANEVSVGDQERAQAAIFKFMVFVKKNVKTDMVYVMERRSGETTFRKTKGVKKDMFLSSDMVDEIEQYVASRPNK